MMDSPDDDDQCEDRFEAVINILSIFLDYYEKWNWKESGSDIKSAFTTARQCEIVYSELAQSNCLLYFDMYLSQWLPRRYPDTMSKKYDVSLLKNSCDLLLEKFLRSGKEISNEIVRQAVLNYTSLFCEQRLSDLLDKLSERSNMFKLVCDVKDSVDHRAGAENGLDDVQVLHQQLSQLADLNNVDNFKVLVKKILVSGTIYKYLFFYFGNKVPTRIDDETNNLVIKLLVEQLHDNECLRWKFLKMSSPSELELLGVLANSYPDFLTSMIDFILVAGNDLEMTFDDKFQLEWTGPDSSLTYKEVLELIKCLINSHGIAEIKMKSILLKNANSDEDDTTIWSYVVYALGIEN